MSDIRIYVADLAAYNNGKLHGVWLDATDDVKTINAQIQTMLQSSPEGFAEEFAIHDFEGFGSYRIGEYENIESVHAIACFIEEHEAIGGDLLNYFNGDIEEATKAMEEQYCGCFEAKADFIQDLTEQTTKIPEHIQFYIDYERMGRDMELNCEIFTIETAYQEVHIFWCQ